jgi:hypothetical protein
MIAFLLICGMLGFLGYRRPRVLWQIVSWAFVLFVVAVAIGKS